jgi:putative heme-binding domain-containing protein
MDFDRAGAFLVVCAILMFGTCREAHAQNENSILGARRFLQFCAGCHGADGRGGDKAASLATSESVRTHTDQDLFRIVHDGTTDGMPPFAQIGETNIMAVVHFLRMLESQSASTNETTKIGVMGDINSGRALYFGKAQCSTCHMMQGRGGFIASDLTAYGRNHNASSILKAITTPDSPLVPSSRVVTVTTRRGRIFTGVLRNEDNFSLDLQTEDGRYHLLARSDLTDVHYTDHSLMPRDYGALLSSSELDDIAAFLVLESRSPSKSAGQDE